MRYGSLPRTGIHAVDLESSFGGDETIQDVIAHPFGLALKGITPTPTTRADYTESVASFHWDPACTDPPFPGCSWKRDQRVRLRFAPAPERPRPGTSLF